jgi:hypothetical protein
MHKYTFSLFDYCLFVLWRYISKIHWRMVKSAIACSAYFIVAFTYLPTVRYQGNFWGVKGDLTW